ncbi:MAG: hypothetical protein IMW93_09310 [Thermoanaerobacteraceae bacterium]|nr:hypothetical protein [Thermoanaerobacteraceae bacterium]
MLSCKVRNAFIILGPLFIIAAFTNLFGSILSLVLMAFGVSMVMMLIFRGRH